MHVAGVEIEDTFAEAFPMVGCRLIVTAATERWVRIAASEATGYAASVIGCDAEAGVERWLGPSETPDGRPGVSLLFFSFGKKGLTKAVTNRVGQCIMTCASTACFDGLPDEESRIDVANQFRYFGDGHQISKLLGDRRFWRVPVMDGEFLCSADAGVRKGVAGGNYLILATELDTALAAAEAGVDAIVALPDAICPFPGGVVRSGSKVGSKYKALKASTNDAYCPTLRGAPGVTSALTTRPGEEREIGAVYEIVIDGLSAEAVATAMRVGIHASCEVPGVVRISAGNYGGNLGPHHFRLHDVLATG